MAWRNIELEGIVGGTLDSSGLTESAVERLVTERVTESDLLDFKGDVYPTTSRPRPLWTNEQEFAKDVAAFANERGGLLLLGVQDAQGTAVATTPIRGISPEREERRLRQALLNNQAPVVDCSFVWMKATSGGHYAGIVIAPSRRAPHAVLGDPGDNKRPLRYPVRHGSDTTWLTEHEVAERYRRRLAFQEDDAARVRRVIAEGCDTMRMVEGVWLFVAVVPERPAAGSLDRLAVERTQRWFDGHRPSSPLGRDLPAYGRGIPAPRRVTFTGGRRLASDDETYIQDAYLELHMDGSAFSATPLGGIGETRSGR